MGQRVLCETAMVVEMQRFLIAMDYKGLQELILSLVIYFS